MVKVIMSVPNGVIESDFKLTSVHQEIKRFFTKYSNNLTVKPNELAKTVLLDGHKTAGTS